MAQQQRWMSIALMLTVTIVYCIENEYRPDLVLSYLVIQLNSFVVGCSQWRIQINDGLCSINGKQYKKEDSDEDQR